MRRVAKAFPWEVIKLKGSPAKFIGLVYADDETAAAIAEYAIRPVDQKRLLVRPWR